MLQRGTDQTHRLILGRYFERHAAVDVLQAVLDVAIQHAAVPCLEERLLEEAVARFLARLPRLAAHECTRRQPAHAAGIDIGFGQNGIDEYERREQRRICGGGVGSGASAKRVANADEEAAAVGAGGGKRRTGRKKRDVVQLCENGRDIGRSQQR